MAGLADKQGRLDFAFESFNLDATMTAVQFRRSLANYVRLLSHKSRSKKPLEREGLLVGGRGPTSHGLGSEPHSSGSQTL